MFKNYLRIALRNLSKHKIYSFINILGLSIGITCTILIMLWVQDELSYDRFHKNADNLYRIINYKDKFQDKGAGTPAPLGPALKKEIPEIVNFTRIASPFPIIVVKNGNNKFYENRLVYADPDIFAMFTFPFLQGNPATAFSDPHSIILTEAMAYKYFGNKNPVGKVLTLDGQFDAIVSGVIKNIPHNSHIQFDFLLPFKNIITEDILGVEWFDFSFNTYVQLKDHSAYTALNRQITDLAKAHNCPQIVYSKLEFGLQPIKEVHLDADTQLAGIEVMSELGDKTNVYVFSLIAFLILCIACINFMNLSTARSANRSMEVGMRKVLGANRFQLRQQFLAESMLMTIIAFVIALVFIGLLFPLFNDLTGKQLTFSIFNYRYILGVFGLTLLTGFIAGIYPAFYMSSFQSITLLKKQSLIPAGSFKGLSKQIKNSVFRKFLVVSQFCISITLIIGTFVIYKQLRYVRNRNLGFDKSNTLLLPIRENFAMKYDLIKTRLLQDPNIIGVTAQDWLQIRGPHNAGGLAFDWQENAGKGHNYMISHIRVDYDFIPTLGIRIVEGRNFSRNHPSDAQDAFILNEAAVKMMGMKSPIGKRFRLYGQVGKIVGVMQNAYFSSLHRKIEPQVYHVLTNAINSQVCGAMLVKVNGSKIAAGLSSIEKIWQAENPNSPFEFQFFDEAIDQRYKSDQRTGKIFNYFAILAIFISCLGLFGLASYMVEQKTREIAIRKVLGASISGIVSLLSKEFVKWIIVANIITWPLAYYFMNKWLQDFAYRIDIGLWIFVISGGIALLIALATVSVQAIKAATANPVESLKYE
ncbi:ABC transporter permease [candidate division KSB1 bacterium]|nr:ABC transporter permease [candidate division KSB1 bacterium]